MHQPPQTPAPNHMQLQTSLYMITQLPTSPSLLSPAATSLLICKAPFPHTHLHRGACLTNSSLFHWAKSKTTKKLSEFRDVGWFYTNLHADYTSTASTTSACDQAWANALLSPNYRVHRSIKEKEKNPNNTKKTQKNPCYKSQEAS